MKHPHLHHALQLGRAQPQMRACMQVHPNSLTMGVLSQVAVERSALLGLWLVLDEALDGCARRTHARPRALILHVV